MAIQQDATCLISWQLLICAETAASSFYTFSQAFVLYSFPSSLGLLLYVKQKRVSYSFLWIKVLGFKTLSVGNLTGKSQILKN